MLATRPRSRAVPAIPILNSQDTAVETWLRDEVVPVFDAMIADPTRGVSIDHVAAALDAHHTDRSQKAKRDA